jgi:glycosyltransferase involved in cell wall biosynthesis
VPGVQSSTARRRLRSLWGTTPIISISSTSKAEALLGITSHTLVFSRYFVTGAFTHDLSRYCRNSCLKVLVPFLVLPWALLRYDVFHFFADRGILPSWRRHGFNILELLLLRVLGKKLFVYTYGGDVRTRRATLALGRYNCCVHCPEPGRFCVCDEDRHARNMARLRRYATAVLAMGDMAEYTPGSDNSLFFWPIDLVRVPYVGARADAVPPIRIVHAPNHRYFKGTQYLVDAVEELQREGLQVELRCVEGVPNDEAMKLYADADIVAEQFLIGWHGYHAIEAMALGKPVVCYIRKPEYHPAPRECPIVSASPDELAGALRGLVTDSAKRRALGEQGRAYVREHYSLEAFAERLRRLYQRHRVLPLAG